MSVDSQESCSQRMKTQDILQRIRNTCAGVHRWLDPAHLFSAMGLPFGLLIVFATGPFEVPDEPAHFCRAYQVSTGTLLGQKDGDRVGGHLPSSIVEMIEYNRKTYIPWQIEHKISLDYILKETERSLEPQKTAFQSFPRTAVYSPALYLPQATGILVGRAAGLSPLGLLYMSRLVNLLFFVVLVRWALAVLPVMQWTLLLLAMMPMTMFQAASCSADSVVFGGSFLFVSFACRFALDSGWKSGKSVWRLAAAAACYGLLKPYLTICASSCLVSARRFVSRKSYWLWLCAVWGACLLAAWSWAYVARSLVDQGSSKVDVPAQSAHVLQHIGYFLAVVARTWRYWYRSYLIQMIGRLGWLDCTLPWRYYQVFTLMLVAVPVVECADRKVLFSWWQRVLGVGLFLLTLLSVSLWILVSWNTIVPGQTTVIHGIQGRYMIPALPLLLIAFQNPYGEKLRGLLKYGMVAFLTLTIWVTVGSLLDRYYGI